MASNYTTHYGLCQWEPGDNFIREEFNRDNGKVEQALSGLDGRAAELEKTLPLVSGNVYNLMLQSYYDGKQTGYKKGLVFDGFMDRSMIDSISGGIVRRDNRLSLMRAGQGDISMGSYADMAYPITQLLSSPAGTAMGNGTLTGAVVKTINLVNAEKLLGNWELKVYLNNQLVRNVTVPLYCEANSVAAEQNIYYDVCTVKPGDTFYMTMKALDTNRQVFCNTSGQICGRYKITPLAGTAGTLTTPALDLPDRRRLRGWLRHRGGSVAVSVRDSGGTLYPIPLTGTRQTVSLQGAACTEREFVLDSVPETGPLTFRFDMSLGADDDMELFDYGVMLI